MKKFYLFLMALVVQLAIAQDGSLDASFNPTVNTSTFSPIAAYGTGVVTAEYGQATKLHKFLGNGQADPNFNSLQILPFNATGSLRFVHSLYVETSGNILVGGYFGRYGRNNRNNLFRINSQGALDTNFVPNLPADFVVLDIIVQQGVIGPNNILVVGATTGATNINRYIYRLNSVTGAIDTTFNQQGPNQAVTSIDTYNNGEIIIVGEFTQVNGQNISHIAKLTSNGFPISSFNPTTTLNVVNISTSKVLIQDDDKILVSGYIEIDSLPKSLLRLHSNGTIDSGFITSISSNNGVPSVYDIDIDANGKILIVGDFNGVNTINRNGIARLCGIDGSVDLAFNPGSGVHAEQGGHLVFGSLDVNNNIFINGTFTDYNGTVRFDLAKVFNNSSPSNTAIAQADNFTTVIPTSAELVGNILTNDTFNGQAATSNNVTITSTPTTYLSINAGGKVVVAPQTPAGTYTIAYTICPQTSGCGCSTALVTVTVRSALNAVDDTKEIICNLAARPLNVLSNDTYYNGSSNVTASLSNVTVTQISTTHPNVTIGTTGILMVNPTIIPTGTYTIVYKICSKVNPQDCDTAIVTVYIPVCPLASNDDVTVSLCTDTTYNVLSNDNFNGVPVNQTQYPIILQTLTPIPAGLAFNTNTGDITVASTILPGTYSFEYAFGVSLGDISAATVTITVEPCNFNPETGLGGVETVSMQSDGKVILGGRNRLYRLNTDLSSDTSFNSANQSTTGDIFESAVQPDDKILIGGTFATYNGVFHRMIARLHSDGTLDNSFNPIVTYYNPSGVYAITIQDDGKILIGGTFYQVNGSQRTLLARLNSDGTLDPTFNSYINYNNSNAGIVHDIAVLPDGKILIGGTFIIGNRAGFARLNSDGTLDSTFNTGGIGFTSTPKIRTICVQPNGQIIVGGEFDKYNYYSVDNIARINADGSLDTTFNSHTDNMVTSISITNNGIIVIGGLFENYNQEAVNRVAIINQNGTISSSLNIGTGVNHAVRDSYTQPDGKVIIAGEFNQYNGINRPGVTRILPWIAGSEGRMSNNTNGIAKDLIYNFTIYPNPSTGIFNFDLSGFENEKFDLEIFNPLGQLIYQDTVSHDTANQIDLSRFESGNYFVRLQNNQTTINKIIVKK